MGIHPSIHPGIHHPSNVSPSLKPGLILSIPSEHTHTQLSCVLSCPVLHICPSLHHPCIRPSVPSHVHTSPVNLPIHPSICPHCYPPIHSCAHSSTLPQMIQMLVNPFILPHIPLAVHPSISYLVIKQSLVSFVQTASSVAFLYPHSSTAHFLLSRHQTLSIPVASLT